MFLKDNGRLGRRREHLTGIRTAPEGPSAARGSAASAYGRMPTSFGVAQASMAPGLRLGRRAELSLGDCDAEAIGEADPDALPALLVEVKEAGEVAWEPFY